jgi:hypothetical protein
MHIIVGVWPFLITFYEPPSRRACLTTEIGRAAAARGPNDLTIQIQKIFFITVHSFSPVFCGLSSRFAYACSPRYTLKEQAM